MEHRVHAGPKRLRTAPERAVGADAIASHSWPACGSSAKRSSQLEPEARHAHGEHRGRRPEGLELEALATGSRRRLVALGRSELRVHALGEDRPRSATPGWNCRLRPPPGQSGWPGYRLFWSSTGVAMQPAASTTSLRVHLEARDCGAPVNGARRRCRLRRRPTRRPLHRGPRCTLQGSQHSRALEPDGGGDEADVHRSAWRGCDSR